MKTHYRMTVDVTGESIQEAWTKLTCLVSEACVSKNSDGRQQYPEWLMTNDGQIGAVKETVEDQK